MKNTIILVLAVALLFSGCLGQDKTPDSTDKQLDYTPVKLSEEAEEKELERLLSAVNKTGGYKCRIKTRDPYGMTTESDYWIKGDKIKMKSKSPITNEDMIILLNEDGLHIYDPVNKTAMKMVGIDALQQNMSMETDIREDRSGASIVGTATFDGKPVTVVALDYPNAKGEIWLWTENGVPLKIKSIDDKGVSVMECYDVVTNIPDSEFILPDDVIVTNFEDAYAEAMQQLSQENIEGELAGQGPLEGLGLGTP